MHAPPRRPADWHRTLLLLIVVIGTFGTVFLGVREAEAHARLVSATPPGGSALSTSPTEFRLQFSEPVDIQFSRADLVADDGTAFPLAPLETPVNDAKIVFIRPTDPATLPVGVYTIVWRVISGTDAHSTTGTLAFSIGTGIQPPGSTASDDAANPPWWRVGLRWFNLLVLLIVTGGVAFGALVTRPISGNTERPVQLNRTLHTLWRGAFSVAIVGQVVALHNQAVVAGNLGFVSLPSPETYHRLLFSSTFGTAWLIRLSILLVLLSVRRNKAQTETCRRRLIGMLLSTALLFTISVAGHAAGEKQRTLAIVIDWLHLNGAAVWFGGLIFLLVSLLALQRDSRPEANEDGAQLIRRFSQMVLIAVSVLILSGVINTAFHVAGPQSLRREDYGVTLIAKHLLVLVIIVPAAINVLMIRPRLHPSAWNRETSPRASLAANLRIATIAVAAEVILGVFVVLASANLTELPPADAPLAIDVAPKIVTINQRATVADVNLWLLARLTGDADNRFTLSLNQPKDAPPIQRLIVDATLPGTAERSEIADRFDAQPLAGDSTTFSFPAVRLGLQGLWTVSVVVRRAGVDDLRTAFAVDTSQAGIPPSRVASDAWTLPRIPISAWGLFLLAIVVALGGILGVKRLPDLEPLAATLILTMIVLITAGFTVSGARLTIPVTAGTDLSNPKTSDIGSVVRGESLYAANCLACHGPAGAGVETPDPDHGHGSSADLTDRQSRLQTDGDYFFSISNGVPGTDMPAYDFALTETERWDLVTYLRELQQNAQTSDVRRTDEP